MILYIRDPKNSTRKIWTLKVNSQCGRIQINLQNQELFMPPPTNTYEEDMDTQPFTTALKKMKYLGVHLAKENLYNHILKL